MAPAIVHFLVGASLVLLAATPFALRYRSVRQWGMELVVVGGLWGLAPDVHHVAPVFREELYAVHDSPVTLAFAFHYALDRSAVRELYLESIAASILLFVASATAFTLAARAGERDLGSGSESEIARVLASATALIAASALAAGVFGGTMHFAGRTGMDGVAALYGRESALAGWALAFALSLVAGALFAAFLALAVPGRYANDPRLGALLGLPLGIAAWALAVPVALPVWARFVLETGLPIPYLEWTSLLALALAGVLFGACYPLVKGSVASLEGR